MRHRLQSRSRHRFGAAVALVIFLWPISLSGGLAWEALEQPGTVVIMRHAFAPGSGDPEDFTLGDCETQRNLDERGRAQARAIGAAFREHGVTVDRVLTSQWCRAEETALLLGLAPVEEFPPLNSLFSDFGAWREQTEETRALLYGLPADERIVLVTHLFNVVALIGRLPSPGEVFVVDVADNGSLEVLGEILIHPESLTGL